VSVVSRAMATHRRPFRRVVLIVAASAVLLSACSAAAVPSASAPAAPPASKLSSADPGTGGGSDGSSGGNVGSGGAVIVDPTPVDPAAGQPAIVVPKPGQKNPHPVGATTLQASVDGAHVLVKVTWYSGVEPCHVLDSVKVERSASEVTIGLVEGSSDLDAMCIEIAQLKATIVDLGDLTPGTWTIRAESGEAPPIQVTIS
jgi:hypothetical protein